ncbi:hypothetical protein HK105_203190 [Polyrhizophydium stewartii]|uniref:Chitin-binding type-4 domain-containing protein n=1 Tax=Polyrhizophydium stewartii TaxID=2732419 RepID=A0ABR4NC81_9FUNG
MLISSLVLALASASLASANAFLVAPSPRSSGTQLSVPGASGIKIPTLPVPADMLTAAGGCLDSVRGYASASVAPGGTVGVNWQIVVDHASDPGVRIAVLFDGDDQFTVLRDGIDVHDQAAMVTLPDSKAGAATLQWLWASQEDGGFYLACADIDVSNQNVDQAAAAGQTDAITVDAFAADAPADPTVPSTDNTDDNSGNTDGGNTDNGGNTDTGNTGTGSGSDQTTQSASYKRKRSWKA